MSNPLIKRIFGLTPFRLSLILIALMLVFYVSGPTFVEVVELIAMDTMFRLRGPIKPGPEVAIAVIDEKSLDEIGRWPWPRSKIARLVDVLSRDQAKVIAFDIGFFEPDINTHIDLIDRLGSEITKLGIHDDVLKKTLVRERELADNDRIMAKALAASQSPVILGYFFHMDPGEAMAHITPEKFQQKIDSVLNGRYTAVMKVSENIAPDSKMFLKAYMPESNISLLAAESEASGYFNMFPDLDGTIRWVPLVLSCEDSLYMPLSIQALKNYAGAEQAIPFVTEAGIDHIDVGAYRVPTDELGRYLVNYRGPKQTFKHYPIADIINGVYPPGTFKDRVVMVGATAVGIYDLRVTPFDSTFPGIEVHATVVDNILHHDFLLRPGWAGLFDMASIVFVGLVLGIVLSRLTAIWGFVFGTFLAAAWTGTTYLLFIRGTWVNIIYPLLTLIVVFLGINTYRYITEEREKKKIKGAFSYYVNASVVSEMLKNPEMLKLGGDKRILTVLFSDIRGFTTISEQMDPESLVHMLNQYLTVMTDIVFKYDGLVDKYIGDAVMAVWGAPLSQPKHALLACRAGLEMMAALEELRKKWALEDESIPFIDIGIGLNSGPMVVGNMGSEARFDYTVMGDAVNLGSRLEGANKHYGTNIIIGEMTYQQINEDLYCRELDSVAVKGKEKPVKIYELLGDYRRVPDEKLNMARSFSRGLNAYKRQKWQEARRIYSAINCYYPEDKPTEMYLKRITELEKNPPDPNWNGVFVMKTK